MKTLDLIGTAIGNTFRSRTRTILTILAIFVGAFTLALTSGMGTGINAYIDDTVTSVGAEDRMTVTKPSDEAAAGGEEGPSEYDPDTIASGQPGPPGATVTALTLEDIQVLGDIEGVLEVDAIKSVSTDYIAIGDGTQYAVSSGGLIPGQNLQLAAGAAPDDSASAMELALPVSYVDALGFADADAAVGATAVIGITDATGAQHTVDASIVGVVEESLAGGTGASIVPNAALTDELFALQSAGLPEGEADRYAQASVRFDADATEEEIADLKASLEDEGYSGTTVADQLGTFKTVIDAIVLVLNAFAVIALLAASFGIVNTLYMSVQERTREIGLMKAMGMGSGRVFSLFSIEAAFIGFLGSALGVVVAMAAGSALSSALAGSLLADLPGLTLIAFDPASIAVIILLVMGIAFLAGTLPASRAAKADPVTSLRYE